MAIFNELAQRANRTREDLIQKTQDLSESGKLTRALADAEKKRKQILQQIGEKYVQLHSADYEPDIADVMQMFSTNEKTITEYQRQIREIKGVVTCTGCGSEIPKNAAFCQNCGKPAPKEEELVPAGYVKCGRCRALVEDCMSFCSNCGSPVQKPEKKLLCTNCGAALKDTMRFCSKCGTPVQQEKFESREEEIVVTPEETVLPDDSQKSIAEQMTMELDPMTEQNDHTEE